MTKDFDKFCEILSNTKPTQTQMLDYGLAIRELADGLAQNDVWSIFRNVENALYYLERFRGHFVKVPTLTKKQGILARRLHTYIRKCMDNHFGYILNEMITANRGIAVWYAFIKGLDSNKNNYHKAIDEADNAYELNKITDNRIMLGLLQMWKKENFADAIEWLNGGDNEGEAGTA